MMKWMLAAGAAALAISVPASAERGGGGGKDKAQTAKADRGAKAQDAQSQRRGGGDRQVRAQRGGGGDQQRARQQSFVQDDNRGRGKGRDQVRVETRGGDRAQVVRVDDNRGRGRDEGVRTVRVEGDAIRGKGKDRFVVVDGNDIVRVRDLDRGVVRVRDIDRDDLFVQRLGWGAGGCPPGLAKKNNGCMPPGQAKKLIGQPLSSAMRLAALDPLPSPFRSLFLDDDDYYYRWGGGYMYRVDRDNDFISSMIPLFGAALLGQPLQPAYLNPYQPSYFSSFYPNSPYDCYRYGYGYVYETDCMTGLVEDVIPTYDYGYGVGQLMPSSYSYYNLPYTYRSSFIDNDDYYYRYAPGAIYQVDRSSTLISAVVALLTNGLSVGQPLPMGYSAYNVPLAYRSIYYDTPDMWYRYDNGYIYAVDPGTRMVNSVAYAIV